MKGFLKFILSVLLLTIALNATAQRRHHAPVKQEKNSASDQKKETKKKEEKQKKKQAQTTAAKQHAATPVIPAARREGNSDTTIAGTTLEVIQVYKPEIKPAPKPEYYPTLPSMTDAHSTHLILPVYSANPPPP